MQNRDTKVKTNTTVTPTGSHCKVFEHETLLTFKKNGCYDPINGKELLFWYH